MEITWVEYYIALNAGHSVNNWAETVIEKDGAGLRKHTAQGFPPRGDEIKRKRGKRGHHCKLSSTYLPLCPLLGQRLIEWAQFLWQPIKPAKRVQMSTWANNSTSLSPSRLFCKMRTMLIYMGSCHKTSVHTCKVTSTWLYVEVLSDAGLLARGGHSILGRCTLFHAHVASSHGIAEEHWNPRVLWARRNLRNNVSLLKVALPLTHCLVHAHTKK